MIAPEPTVSLKTTILQITVFWNRIPPEKKLETAIFQDVRYIQYSM